MVKTYIQLYADARKALLEKENPQDASFYARQLIQQITAMTYAQFLAHQQDYAPETVVEAVEKGGLLSIFGLDNAQAKKVYIGFVVTILLIVALFWSWVAYKKRQIAKRKARREERQKRIAEAKAQKEQEDEEYRKRAEWEKEYDKRYENRYR